MTETPEQRLRRILATVEAEFIEFNQEKEIEKQEFNPKMKHKCDEKCICPIHKTPLWYSSPTNDHACQDVECEFGHGGL